MLRRALSPIYVEGGYVIRDVHYGNRKKTFPHLCGGAPVASGTYAEYSTLPRVCGDFPICSPAMTNPFPSVSLRKLRKQDHPDAGVSVLPRLFLWEMFYTGNFQNNNTNGYSKQQYLSSEDSLFYAQNGGSVPEEQRFCRL